MSILPRKVCTGIGVFLLGVNAFVPFSFTANGQTTPTETPVLAVRLETGAQLRIAWASSWVNFALEQTTSLSRTDSWQRVGFPPLLEGGQWVVRLPTVDQARFFRLREVISSVTTIIDSAPRNRENGVAVTRETIVRFSAPLSPTTQITTDQIYAEFGGQRTLSRVELSEDSRSATLFYLEPLPGSARVRVTIVGDALLDQQGRALDADGDGRPGGVGVIEFTTLSLSSVPNTAVAGKVFASEIGSGTDGQPINRPLVGAIITLDGREQEVRAATAADGSFTLSPVPAGEFFVHIDGRTAAGSQWPDGSYYPVVGKSWHGVAGRTNTAAGGTGEIFLPLVAAGTLRPVSMTQDTEVTFPDSVLQDNPGLTGVSVTVPANSLFSESGARGGRVGIAPVPPDRLPGPLPEGLGFPLVITVQTDGPLNFDTPAPVKFPNLPDPVTGTILPPGAKTGLWSFNHDTGRWELQGSMTISADGKFAVSDSGVGILQPGWHGTNPNGTGGGGGGGPGPGPGPCTNPPCPPPGPGPCAVPPCGDDPCEKERKKAIVAGGECAIALLSLIPGVGCGIGLAAGAGSAVAECLVDSSGNSCVKSFAANAALSAIGCFPVIGGAGAAALTCAFGARDAKRNYDWCKNPPLRRSILANGRLQFPSAVSPGVTGNVWEQQIELWSASARFYDSFLGNTNWTAVALEDLRASHAIIEGVFSAGQVGTEDEERISASERSAITLLPRPANIGESDVLALIDRIDRMNAELLTPLELQLGNIISAAQSLRDTLMDLEAKGWESTFEVFDDLLRLAQEQDASFNLGGSVSTSSAALAAQPPPATSGSGASLYPFLHYKLVNMETGFIRRGQLNASGEFFGIILPADTPYFVEYAAPDSLQVAATVFRSAPPAGNVSIPRSLLAPDDSSDSDGDELPDSTESILGTNPSSPDTDGDGTPDGAEVRNGTNPLDGIAVATGIIASLETTGFATAICMAGDVAVLAGPQGLSLIDVSNLFAPVQLSRLPLGGEADMIAGAGAKLVVGLNTRVAIADIADPAEPRLSREIAISGRVNAVAALGAHAYVGTRTAPRVQKIEFLTGQVLWEWTTDGRVDGIGFARGRVFLLTDRSLQIIEDSTGTPRLVGSVAVSADAAPLEKGRKLFVGGDYAYAGYFTGYSVIDVRDPAAPEIVGAPPQTQLAIHDIAATESGRRLGVTSFAGTSTLRVSIYDGRDPAVVDQSLAHFDTPGDARALAIHNGLALVADAQAGLQVINFLEPDRGGVAPAVSLEAGFSFNPPVAEAAHATWLRVNATDDQQVRHVELHVDGRLATLDGSFPFEISFTPPSRIPGRTNFTVRARAVDMSGLSRWSDTLNVTLLDTRPPVADVTPPDGAFIQSGEFTRLNAFFNERVEPATLTTASFRCFEAGPDRMANTADDVAVSGSVTLDASGTTASLVFPAPPGAGLYSGVLSTAIADYSGNRLPSEIRWSFEVRDPNRWITPASGSWATASNWSGGAVRPQDAIVIDVPNVVLTTSLTAGAYSIRSLFSEENFSMSGGALNIQEPAILNGDFTLTGGTLNARQDVTVRGLWTWRTRDTLDGQGTYFANGGLVIDGASSTGRRLGNHTVINTGMARWMGGGILMTHVASEFRNAAGATLELVNTNTAVLSTTLLGSESPVGLINEGTIARRGTNVFLIQLMPVRNSGTIHIESGELELQSVDLLGAGPLRVGAEGRLTVGGAGRTTRETRASIAFEEGGTLALKAGGMTFLPESAITGPGEVLLAVGQIGIQNGIRSDLIVSGAYAVERTTIEGGSMAFFQSTARTRDISLFGELGGQGVFESTGDFLWLSGSMTGGGLTRIRGTLRFGEPPLGIRLPLNNRTLEVFGEVLGEAGRSVLPANSSRVRIQIMPGGTWRQLDDFQIATTSTGSSAGQDHLVLNQGTFLKNGAAQSVVGASLLNEGSLLVEEGNLWVRGAFRQTAGETRLSNSMLQVISINDGFRLEGGTLTGSGEILFGTRAILNVGGVMSPGTSTTAGTLAVTGQYTQQAAGVIVVDILDLPESEAGFDRLTATRNITLDGKLEIRLAQGFLPLIGAVYPVLAGAARQGEFASISGTEIGGDRRFEVVYTATGVELKVSAIQ